MHGYIKNKLDIGHKLNVHKTFRKRPTRHRIHIFRYFKLPLAYKSEKT